MGKQSNDFASLPLRLILGFGFADHGYPKQFGGHEMFSGMLTNLGIPALVGRTEDCTRER